MDDWEMSRLFQSYEVYGFFILQVEPGHSIPAVSVMEPLVPIPGVL